MEGLDFGTLLDDEQIDSLFGSIDEEDTVEKEDKEEKEINEEKENITEVDPENIFEEKPESVGNEDNKENKEDVFSEKDGNSPDFFSSIANAFAEEGIFPDLDENTIKGIKTAKDFRKAIDDQIKAGLDEQQQRVIEALDNNVEPSKIKYYENLISYLQSIDNDAIEDEGEQGETLRKQILMQDYLNRGFTKERAEKAVNRALSNGTDIEEAKEALDSNKSFFKDKYAQELKFAKEEKEREEKDREQAIVKMRKTMLEEDIDLFKGMEVDSSIRQKAFDAISKPVYRDPKTGEYHTAIQKLELENREDFLAKLGFMYALTNGFKSFDGIVKKKVNKEMKKGFSELEQRINNSRRDSNGNLTFASGVNDTESILGKGMKLDF